MKRDALKHIVSTKFETNENDFPKYLTLGKKHKNLKLSLKATKNMLLIIAKQKNVTKIFIEPHLKQRFNLKNLKIKYYGCQAVRHYDHLHFQVK